MGAGALGHYDFIARHGEKCRQDKGSWFHGPIFFSFWLRVNTTGRELIRGRDGGDVNFDRQLYAFSCAPALTC